MEIFRSFFKVKQFKLVVAGGGDASFLYIASLLYVAKTINIIADLIMSKKFLNCFCFAYETVLSLSLRFCLKSLKKIFGSFFLYVTNKKTTFITCFWFKWLSLKFYRILFFLILFCFSTPYF